MCFITGDRIYQAIQTTEKETGNKFHWLCTPSTCHTVNSLEPDIFEQIKWCADHGVSVCMPHRDFTDKHLDKENRVIHDLESILTAIRDAGMITGLSCHYHEVIRVVEERKYDVPLIIQPFNQKELNLTRIQQHWKRLFKVPIFKF